jgi:shikimate kinase
MKELVQKQKKSLIFLAGFMGSGKSTIGPILANSLGYTYVDIDRYIEEKAQKRIVDIFSSEGEQAFRTIEQNTLKEVTDLTHCVVALGGGTIANEENLQMVSQNGILIYLKLTPEEIIHRVQYKSDRPMLKDAHGNQLGPVELQQRINELLHKREPFYTRADVIILADRKRVGATVDEIMKEIRPLMGKE